MEKIYIQHPFCPSMMRGRLKAAAVAVTIIMVGGVFAGCLGGGENNLIQTGSSTVLPLAIAWAEEFEGAQVSVSGGGSTHGLNALLNGEADLADASRLLKGKDYTRVGGDPGWVNEDGTASRPVNGVLPVKWAVAYDVVVVVVNNANDWATRLNFSQLYAIFTDDDPAVTWDQVPGLEDAPGERIEIYAPDEASGTYDYFFERIIPRWGKADQAAGTRLERGYGVYHPSSDDNVILRAVKDNPNAIGYFGFSYYVENQGAIRAVEVAEDDGPYWSPSIDDVAEYPMSRPLHVYSDGVPEPGSSVNAYFRFVLGEEGQSIVPEVGYVRLDLVDPDLLQEQLDRLEGG
jgi:phosphate transport system substrate-binding protein